jgi:hypothetical protein
LDVDGIVQWRTRSACLHDRRRLLNVDFSRRKSRKVTSRPSPCPGIGVTQTRRDDGSTEIVPYVYESVDAFAWTPISPAGIFVLSSIQPLVGLSDGTVLLQAWESGADEPDIAMLTPNNCLWASVSGGSVATG